jgi:hypothetical protein
MKKRRTLRGTLVLISLCLLPAAAAAQPVHFAGLPAAGTKPSAPTPGQMMISLREYGDTRHGDTTWNVYADGTVIWQTFSQSGVATVIPAGANALDTGYVQRQLTPAGLRLLQSKIAQTGLFDHSLYLHRGRRNAQLYDQVRVAGRIVLVSSDASGGSTPTPAQSTALKSLERLIANPSAWLPSRAWANSHLRRYVPSHYVAAFDRSAPDLSKLPPLARAAFSRYYLGHGCLLTTKHTRALLQTFVRAGINPDENHAEIIDFNLAGSQKTPSGRRVPSDFHFSPALPDDHC